MAKYKLLRDIEEYQFTIPKGTIVDIQPMPYGGNTTNFYYQINTKYGQTREIGFDIGSKDLPSFTIEKVSEETPVTLDKNTKKKNIIKATFKSDYEYKTGSTNPQGSMGGLPEIISYKKGNVLGGNLSLSDDKKMIKSWQGNFTFYIPVEYLSILNDDGTPFDISLDNLSPNSNQNTGLDSQTFLEKNKTNLLILGGLVIAYFAYKKFNK
jgi:hypothetical protein